MKSGMKKTVSSHKRIADSNRFDEDGLIIKQGDLNIFMEMVKKASQTNLTYSIPTFFQIIMDKGFERMIFIRGLFKNNDRVMIISSLEISQMAEVINMEHFPKILVIFTNFDEPDVAETIEHLYYSLDIVIIFVTDTDSTIPDIIRNIQVYTLEIAFDLTIFNYKKTNEILSNSGQTEILQKHYEKIVQNIGTNDLRLILSVVMKEKLRDEYRLEKVNYVNLNAARKICFSESGFERKYKSLLMNKDDPRLTEQRNAILNIHSMLTQEIVYLSSDSDVVSKIESMIRNEHTNIINPDDMMAVIKVAAASKDKKIIMSPLLFVGPPGCGKTRFAKKLSTLLGQEQTIIISGTTGCGVSGIMGSTPDYKGASHGKILESIWTSRKDSCCLNPCIIIDEIDKGTYTYAADVNQNLYGTMLSLLEKENSSNFTDNFFQIPINGFMPNYFITANDLTTIPDPLLDRMTVIRFRDYTQDEFISNVIPVKYREFAETHDVPQDLAEEEYALIARLASFSTRRISLAINRYISKSKYLIAGVDEELNDIEYRLQLSDFKIETENRIGFKYRIE